MIMVEDMRLAENLRRIRKEKGLSQVTLGKMCKIPPNSFSDWEKGRCYPPSASLFVVSQALGVSSLEIIGLSKDEIKEVVEKEEIYRLTGESSKLSKLETLALHFIAEQSIDFSPVNL